MGALVGVVAMIVNTLGGLDRVPPVLMKTAAALSVIGFAPDPRQVAGGGAT